MAAFQFLHQNRVINDRHASGINENQTKYGLIGTILQHLFNRCSRSGGVRVLQICIKRKL